MKPYPPRLFYSFMVVFAMAIFFSCTKTDDALRPPAEATTAETEQKFFTQHRSNDAVENALVNYIKQQNNQLHFVEKTVKQIGYPRWDKAIAIAQKKGIISSFGPDGDSTTLYYIPFVRDSQNYVNASMVIAAAPADTSFWYYCDWQYRSLPYASTGTTAFTAERYAMFFMFMDSITLGHSRFNITDTLLFRSAAHPQAEKIIGLKTVLSSGRGGGGGGTTANSNSQGCIDWYYCGDEDWCKANYGQNGCDYMNCVAEPDRCFLMTEYCFDLPESGGGDGGFPDEPIPIEPGGGGNGGGGGGTPSDCDEPQGRGIAARGNLPCDEGPGWEPEPIDEDPPAPNPCDNFIQALKNNTMFANNFKSLMSPANLSAPFEKGYVINFTTGQFEQRQGQAPTIPGAYGEVNLGSSTPVSGTLHNHINGIATMFSPQDIVNQMAKLFTENKAQDPSNLFCGVATANGPYIVKVVDTARFRVMANKIYSPVDLKLQKKFERDNEKKFNWATDSTRNEGEFLYMLKTFSKQGGLALYKGNADCTQWSALSVSSNTHNGQVVYTIDKQNCN